MRTILAVLAGLFLISCGSASHILWRDQLPLLDTTRRVGMYDLRISFMNREIEGLMLTTMNSDNRPRFVLTSYFGMSVFDLEGSSDGYLVNYVTPFLDRKRILDLLWDDLSMLREPNVRSGYEPFRDANGNTVRLRTGRGIRSTKIVAGNYQGVFPQNITIEHPLLNLLLELTVLQNAQGSLYY